LATTINITQKSVEVIDMTKILIIPLKNSKNQEVRSPTNLELLLEVAEAFGWLLAGFLGFGFDCVVEEGMVLIFCCIGSLGRYKPQQSVDIIKTDCCTFTGAGSGFGASHIHKGIPHLHSIMGAAL
jgi:hypothetical protein